MGVSVRIGAAMVAAVLLSPALAGAQIRLCDWPQAGSLPPHRDRNNIVEWASIADEVAPDTLNIANFVVNLDPARSRNIDWEAGSMRVDALRPDNIAVRCLRNARGRAADREGPLYFARDRSSVWTTVYSGIAPAQQDVVAGRPLDLSSDFVLAGGASKGNTAATLRVRVATKLVRTPTGYTISYALTNLSPGDVVIEFPVDPALKEMGDGRIALKKGEERTATAQSDQYPLTVSVPVRIQETADNGTSAVVQTPTLRASRRGRGNAR